MSDDMKLTADEIEEFDALTASRDGANRALGVALNFHANRMALLVDDERRLWDRVKARLDLDDDGGFKVERRRGHVRVVALADDELERARYGFGGPLG